MKKVFLRTTRAVCALVISVAFVPLAAAAHATPIAYVPESSAIVSTAPHVVQVTFSERIEAGASAISVKGPDGSVVSVGNTTMSVDKKTASVGIKDGGQGNYTVVWSVVSADDGHFTKGGSIFEVGTNTGATSTSSGREHLMQTEVVQTSSQAEAFAIFVELLGNGLMWAVLVAYLFFLRIRADNDARGRSLERVLNVTIATGVVLALLGELAHIVFKTRELALVREISLAQSFPLYLATTAGYATVIRAGATAVFATVFFARRASFFAARGINATHIVLVLLLSVFAYSRAMVSHATANPFHPEISVWVNFVHLVAKGFWTGAAALMLALFAREKTRPVALSAFKQYLVCMAVDFLAIVLSGTYIVWLHLKSFGNIPSTLWGETFVQLLSVSMILAGIFAYHALALRYRPGRLRSTIAITLALEFVVGVCVLYLSALMIITSPPLHGAAVVSSVVDKGVTISLVRDQFEDGKYLVSTDSSDETAMPVVTVEDMSDDTGPVGVTLEKRFDGGYVFPAGILSGHGPFSVDITVQQKKGYDAHAAFVHEATQTVAEQSDAPRHLDSFTIVMLLIALLGTVVAVLLWMALVVAGPLGLPDARSVRVGHFAKGAILGICVCLLMPSAASVVFGNSYKKRCLMEGNMWHLMLPVKAGIPVSSTPQEG
jgi:methionine-rich copper-binding protein CopC/putative copper export protein